MSLVNMNSILLHAKQEKYGVGAFNTLNIEAVRGAIRAAEELRSPIILQLAQVHLEAAPIEFLGPVMIEAAKKATVPVAVHFDHGEDLEHIKQALEIGFSSIMFDGASLPFDENIRITKEARILAHSYGATCEAELGRVGGGDDDSADIEKMLTDVEEVKRFIDGTDVDALAIAIGNAHGPYKNAPNLQFERLREINEVTKVPLVLHGGSGISVEGFRKSIGIGIQKINVATALQQSVMKNIEEWIADNRKLFEYFAMYDVIENGIYEGVKEHMQIFMSEGKIRSL